MWSTVFKRSLAVVLLAMAGGAAFAAPRPIDEPQILREPVFGIRYAVKEAHFDRLSRDLLSACAEYADTKTWTVDQMWIYASANEGTRTYYVIGGSLKRRNPMPSEPTHELDPLGGVIAIEGSHCTGFGQAREVFDARYFEEIPQAVLQDLADDLAKRLARGLGGSERLRQSLNQQGVTKGSLTPELATAFRQYAADNGK